MQANEDKLITRLFKDTFIIFLLSMFASRVGDVIDGIISLAVTTTLALMIFLTSATFLFTEQFADLLGAG